MKAPRLISLDALRGLAALAVVLSHMAEPGPAQDQPHQGFSVLASLGTLLTHGRVGVVLFFVISGFCIHLRWSRMLSTGQRPSIDFRTFWKHRFVRLYPPYLVAIGLYLTIQTWFGAIGWSGWDVYDLAMHLAMLHNLDARTIFSIDGVFWTLAVEEQLYLAYFLLLPLRSRVGWPTTLAVCAGARLAWFGLAFAVGQWGGGEFRLVHDGGSLAQWWSWALGAVCVEAALGLIALPRWASRWESAGLSFALAIGCDYATGHHLGGGIGWRLTWLLGSPLWGLGFFVVINRLVEIEAAWRESGRIPRSVTIFASVGLISYSLYLTHNLVLKFMGPTLLARFGLADDLGGRLLLMPPALGFAWLFFRLCEQPLLKLAQQDRSRRVDPGEQERPAPLVNLAQVN